MIVYFEHDAQLLYRMDLDVPPRIGEVLRFHTQRQFIYRVEAVEHSYYPSYPPGLNHSVHVFMVPTAELELSHDPYDDSTVSKLGDDAFGH
jgi:hypothetical protein